MSLTASSIVRSGSMTTTVRLQISERRVVCGSRDSASARTTMSRSVRMPHALPSFLVTMTSPIASSRIIRAASIRVAVSGSVRGRFVITSLIFVFLVLVMGRSPGLGLDASRPPRVAASTATRIPPTRTKSRTDLRVAKRTRRIGPGERPRPVLGGHAQVVVAVTYGRHPPREVFDELARQSIADVPDEDHASAVDEDLDRAGVDLVILEQREHLGANERLEALAPALQRSVDHRRDGNDVMDRVRRRSRRVLLVHRARSATGRALRSLARSTRATISPRAFEGRFGRRRTRHGGAPSLRHRS